MKRQIKMVLVAIVGIIAISVITGCASAPKFGAPTSFQATLNELANQFPIEIAGRQVTLTFEGDFWRGKVDGKDLLAGECRIDVTLDNGEVIRGVNMDNLEERLRRENTTEANIVSTTMTLNQSHIYVEDAPTIPIIRPTKWQKTPRGPEIVLEYIIGPPASLSVR